MQWLIGEPWLAMEEPNLTPNHSDGISFTVIRLLLLGQYTKVGHIL